MEPEQTALLTAFHTESCGRVWGAGALTVQHRRFLLLAEQISLFWN